MAIDYLPTMNRGNRFLHELKNGGTPPGMFVFSPDVAHTEALGRAGFHLAVVDMEHAPLGIADVFNHVRAANAVGVSCWARVGHSQLGEIGRRLDCGAQGVMLPHFGLNRAGSKAAIDAFRYAPKGNRGTCTAVRSVGHGLGDFAAYAERSNSEAMAIGLIEDAAVVEDIDAVLTGCGLDAVVPGGPGDLATSLGLPGQGNHPKVQAAVRRVIEAAKAAPRLKVGLYTASRRTPSHGRAWASTSAFAPSTTGSCRALSGMRTTSCARRFRQDRASPRADAPLHFLRRGNHETTPLASGHPPLVSKQDPHRVASDSRIDYC